MFNLFFFAFAAVVFAFILAMFVTRKSPPNQEETQLLEEDFHRDSKETPSLSLKDLNTLAEKLCQENQLTVKEKLSDGEHESVWVAESSNAFFSGKYIFGFLETHTDHPFATLGDLLEFKDFVRSIGSRKGFFFTTGYFTKDVHQPLEGAEVALYNRRRTLEERRRLNL